SVPEGPVVRKSVDDHLVDGGAQRRGEAAVAQKRGRTAGGDDSTFGDVVQLGGGDAGLDRLRDHRKGLAVDHARFGHGVDLAWSLEVQARTPASASRIRPVTASTSPTPSTRASTPRDA